MLGKVIRGPTYRKNIQHTLNEDEILICRVHLKDLFLAPMFLPLTTPSYQQIHTDTTITSPTNNQKCHHPLNVHSQY